MVELGDCGLLSQKPGHWFENVGGQNSKGAGSPTIMYSVILLSHPIHKLICPSLILHGLRTAPVEATSY